MTTTRKRDSSPYPTANLIHGCVADGTTVSERQWRRNSACSAWDGYVEQVDTSVGSVDEVVHSVVDRILAPHRPVERLQ